MSPLFKHKENKQATVFQKKQLDVQQQNATVQMVNIQANQQNVQRQNNGHSVFGKKKEDVYVVKSDEVHQHYCDERILALQDLLRDNYKADMQMEFRLSADEPQPIPYTEEMREETVTHFREMLSAIAEYVELPAFGTAQNVQAESLIKAVAAIKQFRENDKCIKRASKLAEKYEIYFDLLMNGNLNERKELNLKQAEEKSARTKQADDVARVEAAKNIHYEVDGTGDHAPMMALGDENLEYSNVIKMPVFTQEPSLSDIQQGGLGDCYLLSGLSSEALKHPDRIKEAIQDNGDTVTVRFYTNYEDLRLNQRQEVAESLMMPEVKELRRSTDYTNMTTEQLLYKVLQGKAIDEGITDFLKRNKETLHAYTMQEIHDAFEGLLPTEIAEHNFDVAYQEMDDLLHNTDVNACVANTLTMAQRMAGTQEIKVIVEGLKQKLSESDANQAELFQEALLGLAKALLKKTAIITKDKDFYNDDFKQLLADIREKKPPLENGKVPVYVTVTKQVPVRDKGTKNERWAYANKTLWVQMVEKAYAASGLKKIDTDDKGLAKYTAEIGAELKKYEDRVMNNEVLTEEELQKQAEFVMKLDEMTEKYKHSYAAINGGVTGYFLEHFSGERAELDALGGKPSDIMKVLNGQRASLTSDELNLWDRIIDRLNSQYGVAKRKGENKTYEYKKPIYIEDIEAAFEKVRAKDSTKESVKRKLNRLFSDWSSRAFLHSPMQGEYTPYANSVYAKMRVALESGQTVTCGTKEYASTWFQKHGLNGENMKNGIVERHGYSVLGVKEMDGKRFVQIRNPWASTVLRYVQTTHKDGTVTHETKSEGGDSDGIFYMELNDFISKVMRIDINGQPDRLQNRGA